MDTSDTQGKVDAGYGIDLGEGKQSWSKKHLSNADLQKEWPFLTKTQLEDFRETFQIFDKDHSGYITRENFTEVLSNLSTMPTTQQIDKMMAEVDLDGDEVISFPEFILMMLDKMQQGSPEQELMAVFTVFDRDQSGTITGSELKYAFKLLGENLSIDDQDDIIALADTGGDGEVDYLEFIQLILDDSISHTGPTDIADVQSEALRVWRDDIRVYLDNLQKAKQKRRARATPIGPYYPRERKASMGLTPSSGEGGWGAWWKGLWGGRRAKVVAGPASTTGEQTPRVQTPVDLEGGEDEDDEGDEEEDEDEHLACKKASMISIVSRTAASPASQHAYCHPSLESPTESQKLSSDGPTLSLSRPTGAKAPRVGHTPTDLASPMRITQLDLEGPGPGDDVVGSPTAQLIDKNVQILSLNTVRTPTCPPRSVQSSFPPIHGSALGSKWRQGKREGGRGELRVMSMAGSQSTDKEGRGGEDGGMTPAAVLTQSWSRDSGKKLRPEDTKSLIESWSKEMEGAGGGGGGGYNIRRVPSPAMSEGAADLEGGGG